jgi:hypothetical protein
MFRKERIATDFKSCQHELTLAEQSLANLSLAIDRLHRERELDDQTFYVSEKQIVAMYGHIRNLRIWLTPEIN